MNRSNRLRTLLGQAAVMLCTASLAHAAQGDVMLAVEFGENMVLQSGVKTPLTGTAGRNAEFSLEFRGKTHAVKADAAGLWRLELDEGTLGGPFPMTIKGQNTIELKNVRVADTVLASVCGDGMVLQRGGKAPVFGTTEPGVKVAVEFRGKKYEGAADAAGAWRVDLEPGDAGGPFPLRIQAKSAIELKEVYVGEVWLCSGQSNMHYALSYSKDAGTLKLDPPNPLLRLQRFPEASYAPNRPALRYLGWQAAEKKSAMPFSGTGYYFGAALQEHLKIPVGLIHSAYNATNVSEWTGAWTLEGHKHGKLPEGTLYRRQVRSMQPFAIRGVIWYQGEANAQTLQDPLGLGYDLRLAALIQSWRRDWGQGDFPFLFVQLARIGFGKEQVHGTQLPAPEQRETVAGWARVRDEQRKALDLAPNTGMAVVYDLTTGNLHPPEKKPMGERLALLARSLAYGEKLTASGPLVTGVQRQGDTLIVTFKHAEGLSAKDGELRGFEAAGADGKFVALKGKLEGASVRLDAKGLSGPLTVRYAYREWPDGNLVNAAGLPASPFSTEAK